jgi:hypothetical protein
MIFCGRRFVLWPPPVGAVTGLAHGVMARRVVGFLWTRPVAA